MLHYISISNTKSAVLGTTLVVYYVGCQVSVSSDEFLPEDEKESKGEGPTLKTS